MSIWTQSHTSGHIYIMTYCIPVVFWPTKRTINFLYSLVVIVTLIVTGLRLINELTSKTVQTNQIRIDFETANLTKGVSCLDDFFVDASPEYTAHVGSRHTCENSMYVKVLVLHNYNNDLLHQNVKSQNTNCKCLTDYYHIIHIY